MAYEQEKIKDIIRGYMEGMRKVMWAAQADSDWSRRVRADKTLTELPPRPESMSVVYEREVFSKFCEGVSDRGGFRVSDPTMEEEFDYSKWDLTSCKKSGEFWIVEHENVRGVPGPKGINIGRIYQHKVRELPDGTFRIVSERVKHSRDDKWITIEL